MSGADKRLERLMPALSAQERAVMMLHDFKAGAPQDLTLLHSAPSSQASELNRLIGLMSAANGDLAHITVIVRERVRQEEIRFSLLEWARICAYEMWAVCMRFRGSAREPVTESEYREREAEARTEMLPVDECAMILAEEHGEWDDADCETDEDGDRVATDEAWCRVRDEKAAELRALVAKGVLEGEGKGRRLKIECGSFYDWKEEAVPVCPDVGLEFDVRPDAEAKRVERDRKDHTFIRKLLDRGGCELKLPLDVESPLLLETPTTFGPELARVLALATRTGVRENWRQLRAAEEQLDEMREAFGEDVLHPNLRGYVDEAKEVLIELHEKLQKYTGPFDLPEPDDETRRTVQRIVDNEVRHVAR